MPSSHHYCTHYLTPLHCNAASDNLSEKAGQNFCKWTQLFEKFFPCSQFQDGQYHFEFCSYFWYPNSIRWLGTIIWGENNWLQFHSNSKKEANPAEPTIAKSHHKLFTKITFNEIDALHVKSSKLSFVT